MVRQDEDVAARPADVGELFPLRDKIFGAIFSRVLVYTILFEDNEPDLEFLSLGPSDRVFTIAGAGCGVAAMLAAHPERIDAVDFNKHHLALTALKVEAARNLRSYGELHQLLAIGRHDAARELIGGLSRGMPDDLASYWRRGWRMFRRDFYAQGVGAREVRLVRPFWPITPAYLRALNARPAEERVREVAERLGSAMRGRVLGALMRSPLALLAAGINYTQRERNLRAIGATDVVDGIVRIASRLAATDLDRNWFVWHIGTGRFNFEEPACLPLYLRPTFHERSLGAPTEVRYHHASILDRLQGTDRWTRFCLSDVADWMDDRARADLFAAVHRAAEPGARVICRTVEDDDIVTALGFADRFRLVEPMTTRASEQERSCFYRRVNCYEVVK